jgi:hypothetical protein
MMKVAQIEKTGRVAHCGVIMHKWPVQPDLGETPRGV